MEDRAKTKEIALHWGEKNGLGVMQPGCCGGLGSVWGSQIMDTRRRKYQ